MSATACESCEFIYGPGHVEAPCRHQRRRPCCPRPRLLWCEELAQPIPAWHLVMGGDGVPPVPVTQRPSRAVTTLLGLAGALASGHLASSPWSRR
jgi:hypothetical protein